MKDFRNVFFTLLALVTPFIAMAHEGHGIVNDHSWAHYATSASHIAPVIAVAAVVVFFLVRKSKRASVK